MIIDTTQTKIERDLLEALFAEQCGQIYHSLMQDVQPVTDEIFKQGRWFKNSHGVIFGHIHSSDIHISNKMDILAAGESDDN